MKRLCELAVVVASTDAGSVENFAELWRELAVSRCLHRRGVGGGLAELWRKLAVNRCLHGRGVVETVPIQIAHR